MLFDTLQQLEIRPLGDALGAEVLGLDLAAPLSADDFQRLHDAHLRHHVLVLRDQRITPAQQVAFTRRFGPLQIHVLRDFQLPGHPEVLVVSNIRENGKPIGLGDAGHFWHSDLSYKEQPSLGSLLHAQELPAALRTLVGPLFAEHTYIARYEELRERSPWRPKLTQAQLDEVKPVLHPVVRTHPETGRKALFVSEHFTTRIVGLPDDESRAVLDELFAWSTRPEFVYRHSWRPHDLVFWDNRSVLHLAAGTPDHLRRKLYRTTIEGDVPF